MSETVRELMNSKVMTTSPNTPLPDLQRQFLETRVGALPVVDRDGRLLGIASRSDVVRKYSYEQSLAELAESGFDPIDGDPDDVADANALTAIGAKVGRRLAKTEVADIMITDVVTIEPDASLQDAANRMVSARIHRLPVVEQDRLVGILSAFDFMKLYADRSSTTK